ncbi:MAG: hypothetical protein AB1648_00550 [Pseudomonadota bacterium]
MRRKAQAVLQLQKEGVEFALKALLEAGEQKGDQGGKREFAVALEGVGIEPNRIEQLRRGKIPDKTNQNTQEFRMPLNYP